MPSVRPNPVKIPGFMTKECLTWLSRVGSEADIIVEVGCWRGRGTAALLLHASDSARLYAVDTWQGSGDPKQDQYLKGYSYLDFRENLQFYMKRRQIVPLHMDSLKAAAFLRQTLGTGKVDLVFIDGDHREEAVWADLLSYDPLVRSGGIVAGHDYGTQAWWGVRAAVDRFYSRHISLGPGSIWFVRKP